MKTQRFTVVLEKDDETGGHGMHLPFNPKDAFGKARAPVVVIINGYRFRTTTFSMAGRYWIPINRENREGAGIQAGKRITVIMEPDTEPRTVAVPADLASALAADGEAALAWEKLSFTHRKEHVKYVEEAKKSESKLRRIVKTIEKVKMKQ